MPKINNKMGMNTQHQAYAVLGPNAAMRVSHVSQSFESQSFRAILQHTLLVP
jgi:hypothetical protein